jgi:hypothetical protein
MNRTIVVLLATILLSGCAGLTTSSHCEGGPHSRAVKIHYGDSELTVTPKVANVYRKGDFVLKLQPRKRNNDPAGVNYNAVNVTVVGKTDDDKTWIPSQTESYDSAANHEIVYCVPSGQAPKVYEYEITVVEVGKLDPRAKVNN